MKSRWSDAEAKEFVTRYAAKGVSEDLAVRTYTTRLLGSDPTDAMIKAEKSACANARSKDAMNEPEMFPPRGTWVRSRSSWGSLSSRKDGYVF